MFRSKTIICREGWYFLLVLAFVITGSILREVNLLMIMSGMMLFPLLFNWRSAVSALKGLQVRRQLSPTIAAGDLLVVNVEISKPVTRRLFGLGVSYAIRWEENVVNETAPTEVISQKTRMMFWRVQPGEPVKASYQARLHCRGRYRLGPAVLSCGFPLGLVRHFRTQTMSDSVVVFPRPGQLTGACQNIYRQSKMGTQSSRQKAGMQEGDFHSLRDWQAGDGSRWIHWKTTARRGEPVV
ncbi:MAG: DUF58 domain-containing protein, partial [Planctomycetales bacterium]